MRPPIVKNITSNLKIAIRKRNITTTLEPSSATGTDALNWCSSTRKTGSSL